MKPQNKLTHQVLQNLKQKADALPITPLINNGNVQYTIKTEKLVGAQLIDKYPKQVKQFNEKINLTKKYIIKHRVMQTLNHYVRLQDCYRKKGAEEVEAYIKAITDFHLRHDDLINQQTNK